MSPALTTFVFQLINFLALAAVLGRVFFRPVRKALDERRDKVAAEIAKAGQERAEAEQLRKELESRKRKLDAELDEKRKQTEAAAREAASSILDEAQAKARQEQEAFRTSLQAETRSHLHRVAQSAARAGGDMVKRLLMQIDSPDLQPALEAVACRELAKLNGQINSPLTIESEQAVTDATRSHLQTSLFGHAAVDFRTVSGLGAGLRIITNLGVIDATTSGLARYAEQALCQELEAKVL